MQLLAFPHCMAHSTQSMHARCMHNAAQQPDRWWKWCILLGCQALLLPLLLLRVTGAGRRLARPCVLLQLLRVVAMCAGCQYSKAKVGCAAAHFLTTPKPPVPSSSNSLYSLYSHWWGRGVTQAAMLLASEASDMTTLPVELSRWSCSSCSRACEGWSCLWVPSPAATT